MKMKKWIRLIFILIGGFLLFYFIAPLFAHILNIGNLAGIIFSAALICLGLFLNPILKLVRKIRSKKAGKIAFDSLFVTGCSVMLCFFYCARLNNCGINNQCDKSANSNYFRVCCCG